MKYPLEISATYTDLYQLTMGQAYFLSGRADEPAVFDYFFRKLPFDGGFVIFAGLEDFLETLERFHFNEADIDFLASRGFNKKYLDYLQSFRFRGSIVSCGEGEVVFPTRPVLRAEGGLLETQLIETMLLNLLNFQSLIATKAARMRLAAGDRVLSEFGLRRAQGLGGYHASRAAVVGGMNSTSHVLAARDFGLEANGTMAHSFIQGYEQEIDAFRAYAEVFPDATVLLVDTYDTLESGIPNAIKMGLELRENGHQLKGIRLDSGDLAYLSKRARHMLDEAGLQDVRIVASNQLDEYVIRSLIHQGAPIDIFGVGTSLATGKPDAALDGVYKLAKSAGKPRIKLSETIRKVTLPDRKQVYRILDEEGRFFGADAVTLDGEEQPPVIFDPFEPRKSLDLEGCQAEPQLREVMRDGRITLEQRGLSHAAAWCRQRLALLPDEYKRFDNPHIYKVGISQSLHDLRTRLTNEHSS